ncbi:putative cAMP-dependent protein kinase 5 [Paramicrosporidium saccamoebae]|uniref:Putative cAMP-dependent protein kinase 5 n=1 Tax=Paramicrosporidium saccamoebae TaxID=1246581 RepID=A0A2H9THQ2_9FUNG|nr:putative cAMP-dependent protein kinase 5 [Paramicrosporidium saccamoebae]
MQLYGFLCLALCVQCSVSNGGPRNTDYSRLGMEELLLLPKTMLLDSNGQYIPIYPQWGSQQCSANLFHMESPLGRGGNAVVVRAQHRDNGKTVAIKIFTVDDSEDNVGLIEAIRTEEVLLALLDDPRFPKLWCSFKEGQQVFLVMQYLDGVNLFTELCSTPVPFRLNFTIRVMAEIVEALEFLHRRHIIHRDVKLENIIVTQDGHVYLIDMEHAVYAPDGATLPAGTSCNMAPEMWESKGYDDGVDMWALGLALYEMTTLRHPFQNYLSSNDRLFEAISRGVPATGEPNVDLMRILFFALAVLALISKSHCSSSSISIEDMDVVGQLYEIPSIQTLNISMPAPIPAPVLVSVSGAGSSPEPNYDSLLRDWSTFGNPARRAPSRSASPRPSSGNQLGSKPSARGRANLSSSSDDSSSESESWIQNFDQTAPYAFF